MFDREASSPEAVLAWFHESLRAFLFTHAPSIVLVLVVGLVVLSLRLWWERTRAGRRVRRHYDLGKKAETRAKRLLKREGYLVHEGQLTGRYELLVDETTRAVVVRADFLVEKSGKRYVAEVKSGEESAKLTRSTRRQLLEYLLAFDVDGVLLVDMHRSAIRRVRFPD